MEREGVAVVDEQRQPASVRMTPDEQAAWERAARSGDRFLARDVRLAYLRRVIGADREQGERAA